MTSGTTSPRDLFDLRGKVIADRFRVDDVLGEGGYGVVYSGTHLLLKAPVAIKCLKPTSYTKEERERSLEAFLAEARILFGLSHSAIVRMYDAGITPDAGIPYVVLERLSGVTIADEIAARRAAKRPFDKDELAGIFCPILEGVGFAHDKGIVHRDLKPSNMMLTTGERGQIVPKVLDFGTARATEAARARDLASATTSHAAAGFTPLYAAPEQWDRSLGPFSPRTDVFALGLTIAEACLLAYPLETTHGLVSVVKAVLDERARPLVSETRTDLPIEVERVIHRALHVRPDARYPDARELLASFRAALRVTTTTAPLAKPVASRPSIPSAPAPSPRMAPPETSSAPPPRSAPPSSASSSSPSSPLAWIVAVFAVVVAIAALAALGALLWVDRGEKNGPAAASAEPEPPPVATKLPRVPDAASSGSP